MAETTPNDSAESASAYAASEASKDKGEPSLTSTLTILQRTQLIQLLAACTALQRETITDAFSPDATLPPELREDLRSTGNPKDNLDLNPNIDPGKADVEFFEKQRKLLNEREDELKREDVKKLQQEVLKWFDDWRTEMVGRVGEVVKLRKEARKAMGEEGVKTNTPTESTGAQKGQGQSEDRKIDPEKRTESKEGNHEQVEEELKKLYPPVETPLRELTKIGRAHV